MGILGDLLLKCVAAVPIAERAGRVERIAAHIGMSTNDPRYLWRLRVILVRPIGVDIPALDAVVYRAEVSTPTLERLTKGTTLSEGHYVIGCLAAFPIEALTARRILIEVADVPEAERDALLSLIHNHRLLDRVTSGYDILSIIKAVAAVPAAERVGLLDLIRHHHLLDGVTHGTDEIIREVAAVPAAERDALLGLIHNHRLLDRV